MAACGVIVLNHITKMKPENIEDLVEVELDRLSKPTDIDTLQYQYFPLYDVIAPLSTLEFVKAVCGQVLPKTRV